MSEHVRRHPGGDPSDTTSESHIENRRMDDSQESVPTTGEAPQKDPKPEGPSSRTPPPRPLTPAGTGTAMRAPSGFASSESPDPSMPRTPPPQPLPPPRSSEQTVRTDPTRSPRDSTST